MQGKPHPLLTQKKCPHSESEFDRHGESGVEVCFKREEVEKAALEEATLVELVVELVVLVESVTLEEAILLELVASLEAAAAAALELEEAACKLAFRSSCASQAKAASPAETAPRPETCVC